MPPLTTPVRASRALIRIFYGGSDRQFLAHCNVDKSPFSRRASDNNQRHLVFIAPDVNLHMPTHPGDHGLIVASRHEILDDPPWSVFRRMGDIPPLWEYLGEYRCEVAGSLSSAEFTSQRNEVRNILSCLCCAFSVVLIDRMQVKRAWAKLVNNSLRSDDYVSIRARIALRATKRPLDATTIQEEMDNIKERNGTDVNNEDIIAAFSRGEEVRNDSGMSTCRLTFVL